MVILGYSGLMVNGRETWNHEYGQDLYDYVRNLQPSIIINNRVDAGRAGMQGLTKEGKLCR